MAASLSQLYQVESPLNKSLTMLDSAGQTAGNFQQKQYVPGKTAGGGLMSTLGGAGAGASIGTALGGGAGGVGAATVMGTAITPGIGTAVGAGIGALAYFLS